MSDGTVFTVHVLIESLSVLTVFTVHITVFDAAVFTMHITESLSALTVFTVFIIESLFDVTVFTVHIITESLSDCDPELMVDCKFFFPSAPHVIDK